MTSNTVPSVRLRKMFTAHKEQTSNTVPSVGLRKMFTTHKEQTSNTVPSVGLRKMFTTHKEQTSNSTFYQQDGKTQKNKCLKSGWLKKPGMMRSWQQRWFVVNGDHMSYFTSEDETKSPMGRIFLPNCDVVELPHSNSDADKFLFQIVPGEDKSRRDNGHDTHLLAAASDNERREWIRVIRKVIYAEKGGAIFGQPLSETMQYERRRSPRTVPQLVEQCAQFIMHYGLQVEGIFRLPGRSILIRSLRDEFDCGRQPRFSLPQTDIHSIASLLKQFLRELPEPIIPFQLYERVIQICTRDMHTDEEEALECLSAVLRTMPQHQYNLLHYICNFLHIISQSADVNKMTVMNLATIFMHCFIRPEEDDPILLMGTSSGRTQAVYSLISHSEQIFTPATNASEDTVPIDDLLGFSLSSTTSEPELPLAGYSQVKQGPDTFGADLDDANVSASLPEPLFPAMPDVDTNIKNDVSPVVRPRISRSSFSQREATCYAPSQAARRSSLSGTEPVCPSISPRFLRCQSHNTIAQASPPLPPARPQGLHLCHNGRNAGTLSSTSSPVIELTSSTTSVDTSNSESRKSDIEHDEDDEALDALINTNISRFSPDELYTHVDTLCSELREQRNMIKELNAKVMRLEERHSRQQEKMAEKVYAEKTATATAVKRIIDLQADIQNYQMKYGPLD